MRKILLLLRFFFKSKYSFLLPTKKKMIIYDEHSLNAFENLFDPNDFYVLQVRQYIIYPKILIKSIFKYHLKWNIYNYTIEIIRYINPKLIITTNDNDIFFWKIKKILNNDIKTIFLQNGYRSYSLDIFEILDSNKFNKNDLSVDYFFTFNKSIKKKYLEYLNGQGIVLGSFKNNRKLINKVKKNQNDLLFISEFASPKYFKPPCGHKKYWKPENFYLPIIKKFVLENNLNLKILGKKYVRLDLREEEKIFFEKILGKENWEYVETNHSYECYEKIDQAKLVIFISSTLGYESISRGTPTAALCAREIFEGQNDLKFAWPHKFLKENYFSTNQLDEKKTLKILKTLNSVKKEEWIDYTKNLNFFFMHYDKNNSSFFKVLDKLNIKYNSNTLLN